MRHFGICRFSVFPLRCSSNLASVWHAGVRRSPKCSSVNYSEGYGLTLSEHSKELKKPPVIWFEHPLNGHRVRVRRLGWRIAGFLFGPIGLLVAGLWVNGIACLAVVLIVGLIVATYFPTLPTWLLPIGSIWGLFIPELLEGKYLRKGWLKVVPEGDAATS